MVAECRAIPEEWPGRSNHFLVVTLIEGGTNMVEEPTRHNYRAMDWQAICKEMAIVLGSIEAKEELDSTSEFHDLLHTLTREIQDVIKK